MKLSLNMRTPRSYLIFFTIVLVGLFGVGLIRSNRYPIAVVNARLISAHTFLGQYQAALTYYRNMRTTYPTLSADYPPETVQLKASVLEQLIETALIREAVEKEVGDDLDYLISNKLGRYEADGEFQRAAETLYGLRFPEVRRGMLIPQAEREILAGRLFLNGKNFEEWLVDAKRSAAVTILSGQFRWNGGGVEGKM